jgi:outer membrane lipoprotein-sorting protein
LKKILFIGLISILLTGIVLTTGCSNGGNATTTSVTTTTGQSTQPVTTKTTTATKTTAATTTATTKTTTAASGNSLTDILGKLTGVSSVKYDMVITAPGTGTSTSTVYFKKDKMRMEMSEGGQNMVLLMDMTARVMYNYMPDQNMAYQMTWNPTTQSAADEAQSIMQYNPTAIGIETIDGKVCTVVQYTVEGQTAKMWLWQEHGMPIRVETTSPQGNIIMEYKNIQFIDIPDSTFVLPDGVQITKMPGT